jgi:hypothetical protein
MNELKEILPSCRNPFLVFENDSKETILAILDLLKNVTSSTHLEFRDKKDPAFYQSLGLPYVWYFSPDAEWMNIISASRCEGIILPLKYQDLYHDLPHLWTLIEERNLRIWLHAENAEEAKFFEGQNEIHGSLDLAADVHTSYRAIDQTRLRSMKIWRKNHESPARQ